MGSNLSTELADKDLFPDLDLETAITIQLRSNHYPPVPHSMVPVCIEALDAYNSGEHDKRIELPEGVSWRGEKTSPAREIINGHHLWDWVIESEL